jgi:hypothetical protein
MWGNIDGETVKERAYGKGHLVWRKSPQPAAERSTTAIEAPGLRNSESSTWEVGAPPLAEPEQYGDFALTEEVLGKLGVLPDFESVAGLRYTHRRDGDADIYFVSNPSDRSLEADCTFRVAGRRPEFWDPVTGEIRGLDEFETREGCTFVPLRFEPQQSYFIVFRKPAAGAAQRRRNFPGQEKAGDIGGPWEVMFDPSWGGPGKIMFSALEDWTLRPEDGIRYYSGPATYGTTFDLPFHGDASKKTPGRSRRQIRLDLGTVKNIARVRINGQDLGVVWCAPWQVDISRVVKASGNRLEITVANLWVNRLIGDERLPADSEYAEDGRLARWPEWLLKGGPRPSQGRFAFTTWRHYSRDSSLLPSGLIGPVTFRLSNQ